MKVHCITGYIQNTYLIEYPDKLLLIDSGCSCDRKLIEKTITKKLNRQISDLKLIIISHIHNDHAGGVGYFKSKYKTPTLSHKKLPTWYKGILGPGNLIIDTLLTLYVAKKQGKEIRNILYNPYIQHDYQIDTEMKVPGFEDWKILLTPGHTNSDLTLVNDENKILYSADNIIRHKDRFISPHPITYPELYKDSLNRYKEFLDYQFIFAHGKASNLKEEDIDHLIKKAPKEPLTNAKVLSRILKN